MIDEELRKAFNDVNPSKGIMEYSFKRNSWNILFGYYNSINEKKIHPMCRPCFQKVYYFISNLIKNNPVYTK